MAAWSLFAGSRGLFGVIGYLFIKLGAEPAPLLLGCILGPMMEENLRRALLLVIVLLPSIKKKR